MIEITRKKDRQRLRRIALNAQGLLQTEPYGRGLAGARKAINHIGYVQIDTISVVERAHNHVFQTRVPNFKSDMTNQMLLNRDIFEYWAHAAAFLPIKDFRFSLPYKHAIKNGQTHWYKKRDKKLMNELLQRVRSEGPLRSRDLESGNSKQGGWWDWKPAKKALEQLYMEGALMVTSREGFQKVYDLTERVLPSDISTQVPSIEEFADHILEQQLRCHGLVSLKGLTYLRRNPELRKAIQALLDDKLAQKALEQVRLHTGEVYFVETGAFERRLPRVGNQMKILSPFDNTVIQRDRLKALFDYNYQIECYVPEAKRQYGYFSLPLLYSDEFIGRMDCKAHRKESRLEIKSLHWEEHSFDQGMVIEAFAKAIKQFSQFQNCDSVVLADVYPKDLEERLRTALKQLE